MHLQYGRDMNGCTGYLGGWARVVVCGSPVRRGPRSLPPRSALSCRGLWRGFRGCTACSRARGRSRGCRRAGRTGSRPRPRPDRRKTRSYCAYWHRRGILAGLTARSSSADLRMIFIPSPHPCRLLSKEALAAACGLPLTSPPWVAGQAGAKVWQSHRNGSATWAFMTTFRIGPIARTAARRPGGKHAAVVVRSAIKTP